MNSMWQWVSHLVQQMKLWVVVRPWETAIRVRLGSHAAVVGSGVRLRLPLVHEVLIFNRSFEDRIVPESDARDAGREDRFGCGEYRLSYCRSVGRDALTPAA